MEMFVTKRLQTPGTRRVLSKTSRISLIELVDNRHLEERRIGAFMTKESLGQTDIVHLVQRVLSMLSGYSNNPEPIISSAARISSSTVVMFLFRD